MRDLPVKQRNEIQVHFPKVGAGERRGPVRPQATAEPPRAWSLCQGAGKLVVPGRQSQQEDRRCPMEWWVWAERSGSDEVGAIGGIFGV